MEVNANKKRALNAAIATIKKKYGDECFIDSNNREPIESIPTGCLLLDDAIGIGGLPEGRVVEIYGLESCGKTSLITLIAAEAQKKHPDSYIGIVDIEHAFNPAYAEQLGLNTSDILFTQPDSAEEALDTVLSLTASAACSVVILDSVGGLQTKAQLEKGIGDATMAEVARILSQTMPKVSKAAKKTDTLVIFINQMRSNIGAYQGPDITMGGKALKFFASVRVEMKKREVLMDGDTPIGQRIRIRVAKNKVGTPFGVVDADMLFGYGFDKVKEVIELAIARDIIVRGGAWFTIGDKRFQGKEKVIDFLRSNPEEYEIIKEAVFNGEVGPRLDPQNDLVSESEESDTEE